VTGANSTSMFPDPPEPPPLVQTAAQGPWGGLNYAYRGALIDYNSLFRQKPKRRLIRRGSFRGLHGTSAEGECNPALL
jgi:hypothetical protein